MSDKVKVYSASNPDLEYIEDLLFDIRGHLKKIVTLEEDKANAVRQQNRVALEIYAAKMKTELEDFKQRSDLRWKLAEEARKNDR